MSFGPTVSGIVHEHELADHSAFSQHFVRLPSFGQRKSLRNQRLDLVLLKGD
jgi:hypothetical protein